MTDLRAAAQQALEALEYHVEQTRPIWKTSEAIAALEAALAQAEPVQYNNEPPDWLPKAEQQAEPVQSAAGVDAYDMIDRFLRNNLRDDDYAEYSAALDSLYTAPPKRKPLTEDEIAELTQSYPASSMWRLIVSTVRATERAHGIGKESGDER